MTCQRRRSRRVAVVSGVLVLCVCLVGRSAMAEPMLVHNGQPRADIIISEQPPRMVKLAASELQTYLEKISGAKLPIVSGPGKGVSTHVCVGQSEYTDRLKISGEDLRHGAFRMMSRQNWLVLLGRDSDFVPPEPRRKAMSREDRARTLREWDALTGENRWLFPHDLLHKQYSPKLDLWDYDERGSLNAVYEFLRGLGVRWYMQGELGEVVPPMKTIAIPEVDKVVRPDFSVRYMGMYTPVFISNHKDSILWHLRLGLDPGKDLLGLSACTYIGHGIAMVHGRDEVKRAHPEYYMLAGGKRQTDSPYPWYQHGQACLSSPGLLDANLKLIDDFFRIYPTEPLISVMPTDAYVSLCQCELCKGKATPERGSRGLLSDYVWDYVNRVAQAAYKTHPTKKILCCAYGSYAMPPQKIDRLSPNVAVCMCQGRGNFHDADYRQQTEAIRQAWLPKIASGEFYTYEYYRHRSPGIPYFFPHGIAQDLHHLKGISKGEVAEVINDVGTQFFAPGLTHLNLYVTSRFYWDADQDVDALLAEYYEKYYGPASREMKAFIEFSEVNWPKMSQDAAPIAKAMELLAVARKAAGETVYGERIDLLVEHCKPLAQLHDRLAKGRDKDLPKAYAFERKKADIRLDGKLDDKFWEGLWSCSLRELETGRAPTVRTSFRVGWADNSLYFGIRCDEPDMKNLNIASREKDDPNVFNGDEIELLIETQAHSYYQIAVSPSGAVTDLDRKRGQELLWSSHAEAAVYQGEGYWSLEIRLPVAGDDAEMLDPTNGICGRRPTEVYPWSFNLGRLRVRSKGTEGSAFSPTGTRGFHEVMKFGTLVVK